MKIAKKILGYTLIVLSILIGMALIINLPKLLNETIKVIHQSTPYEQGHLFGSIIGNVIIVLVFYKVFSYGNKLVKS